MSYNDNQNYHNSFNNNHKRYDNRNEYYQNQEHSNVNNNYQQESNSYSENTQNENEQHSETVPATDNNKFKDYIQNVTRDNIETEHLVRLLLIKSYHSKLIQTFNDTPMSFGSKDLEVFQPKTRPLLELLLIELNLNSLNQLSKILTTNISTIHRLYRPITDDDKIIELDDGTIQHKDTERIQARKLKPFLDEVGEIIKCYDEVLKDFDDDFKFSKNNIQLLKSNGGNDNDRSY